jgi:hypothetical protein
MRRNTCPHKRKARQNKLPSWQNKNE